MQRGSVFPPNILPKNISIAAFEQPTYDNKWIARLRVLCRSIRDFVDKNQCPPPIIVAGNDVRTARMMCQLYGDFAGQEERNHNREQWNEDGPFFLPWYPWRWNHVLSKITPGFPILIVDLEKGIGTL